MGPLMQELVSFISIMLGVAILTAWVMWILLRPSGDNKTQEFASESARDGLTLTVIENNELKNKITRLERELKVLMSVGYPSKAEKQEKKGKPEEKKERSTAPDTVDLDERVKIKDKKGKPKGERSRGTVSRAKGLDERAKSKDKGGGAEGKKGKLKGERRTGVIHGAMDLDEEVKLKDKEEEAGEDQAQQAPPLKITDEAEKKKIADYLASVAETTERQMKEVEALAKEDGVLEGETRYPENDLKKIKGIGPHIEGKLKKVGITSFQQIAEFVDEDIQRVSKQIGFFPRRINRDAWVEQAKVLVEQLKVKS